MAIQGFKVDLINGAYSQLRISGITIIPSPVNMRTGLNRLESIVAELVARNVKIPYNFEEEPDLNSPHNLERKYWDAIEVFLASRLAPDFGKEIPMLLLARLKGAISFLYGVTAQVSRTPYPSRMPKGKRQRNFTKKFFEVVDSVPNIPETIIMYIEDQRSFVESFLQVLNDGEIISSFTIEVGNELTINSSSNTDSAISYNITATGTSDKKICYPKLKIKIVTDNNQVITRIINFELLNSEI